MSDLGLWEYPNYYPIQKCYKDLKEEIVKERVTWNWSRGRYFMFCNGDKVEKYTGDYVWEGVICSCFTTPNGHERYVVAHPIDNAVGNGFVLHIYSAKNLRLKDESNAK